MTALSEYYPGRIVEIKSDEYAKFDTARCPRAAVKRITKKGWVQVNLSDEQGYHLKTVTVSPAVMDVWPDE